MPQFDSSSFIVQLLWLFLYFYFVFSLYILLPKKPINKGWLANKIYY